MAGEEGGAFSTSRAPGGTWQGQSPSASSLSLPQNHSGAHQRSDGRRRRQIAALSCLGPFLWLVPPPAPPRITPPTCTSKPEAVGPFFCMVRKKILDGLIAVVGVCTSEAPSPPPPVDLPLLTPCGTRSKCSPHSRHPDAAPSRHPQAWRPLGRARVPPLFLSPSAAKSEAQPS